MCRCVCVCVRVVDEAVVVVVGGGWWVVGDVQRVQRVYNQSNSAPVHNTRVHHVRCSGGSCGKRTLPK
jgi:hypothetical protein